MDSICSIDSMRPVARTRYDSPLCSMYPAPLETLFFSSAWMTSLKVRPYDTSRIGSGCT